MFGARRPPTKSGSAAAFLGVKDMVQLENIEAIDGRLWRAADFLRSGSELASNEYFMPVMGKIFLRHAYSRFLGVRPGIIAGLPSRGSVTLPLTKENFNQSGSIFRRAEGQIEYHSIKADDFTVRSIRSQVGSRR